MLNLVVVALLTLPGCKKQGDVTEPPRPTFDAPAPAEPPPEKKPVQPPSTSEASESFTRVFFEYNSSGLTSAAKDALNRNARIMQKYPDMKIEIQGHCDERGTTDYNLALGQKRGDSVHRYLVSQGISSSRLKVISYGEERPLERSETERAWAQNRRAEFVITWGAPPNVSGTLP